ncbi:heavy metal-associated isoprenylated plant protein 32 [Trifolium pratense]|uniref:heavy metal-associated isoprenylated plant protein 32 n=1 Tax=Trifolium pratense TaxID=57577 RepID=UPI001E690E70|nr:heavy metal-associated isoprenylated plant protein 32 [Trifolium pratense]
MSNEEILKIQKYVLKVNIHCGGCKQKVKKILKKIDGVFITEIDAEQGMVTVYGNVGPNVVIKKLAKSGKPAVIWGNPNANNNNNLNNIANQMKNMQIDNGNDGRNNNNNTATTNNNNLNILGREIFSSRNSIPNQFFSSSDGRQNNQNQPKDSVGGQHQQGQNPQHQQFQQQLQGQNPQQQLQQLQQMKGFGNLNVPQFKDMNMSIKMPPNQNPNMKDVKLSLPEDDDFSDDDDEYSDDESDDEMDNRQQTMKLPMGGNGPAHMMMNGVNHFQLMNAQKGSENDDKNGGGNGKESGGGLETVQFHGLGCGEGNHYSQNQGGGNINNGGKNEGGTSEGKNGNKNVGGSAEIPNNNVFPNMHYQGHHPNMVSMGGAMRTNMSRMNQMGTNMPAVQGLFAGTATSSGVHASGYSGPNIMMGGNPYQQQYMTSMMNQQREIPIGGENVNERFQPMMYAKPPMAANYMYPPPPQYRQDSYSNFFNDENTSSCSIM